MCVCTAILLLAFPYLRFCWQNAPDSGPAHMCFLCPAPASLNSSGQVRSSKGRGLFVVILVSGPHLVMCRACFQLFVPIVLRGPRDAGDQAWVSQCRYGPMSSLSWNPIPGPVCYSLSCKEKCFVFYEMAWKELLP